MRYSKSHPAPKRPRQGTISSSSNDKIIENVFIEENTTNAIEQNLVIEFNDNGNLFNESSIEELLNESKVNQRTGTLSNPLENSTTTISSPKAFTTSSIIAKNNRQVTIVSVSTPSTSNTSTQSSSATSSIIHISSISSQSVIIKPMTESDFLVLNLLCKDAGAENVIYKHGLSNPYKKFGILISSSSTNEFEKAVLFIRNLLFKIHLSISGGGLQNVLAILMTLYINLNAQPDHKVLRMLFGLCNKKKP
ncbi:unnamed protein product [Rotaria magnacalcarata]|uniref:Uncharacterized protein n=1 Tax=Rotaria magnacalcarata TaxID=392030 RepID=A0A8S2J8T5_9BILA|nr:unnamed protein product [Rotaria magnacalcarata]